MKDQIIERAQHQLRQGGYDNLNFGAIASELGITRANIHHHFKNKEGLAEAAVVQYINDEKQSIDQYLQAHWTDLPGFLKAFEDHLIEMAKSQVDLTACIGSQIVRDSIAPPALRHLVLERFREEAHDIEGLVKRYFKEQATGDSVNTDLAFRIVSVMHGVDMMMQIWTDRRDLVERIKGSLTSLVH